MICCFSETCIVLPQFANKQMCSLRRRESLKARRQFYVLSKPSNPPKRFPDESRNLIECVSYPLLNQPSPKVLGRSFADPGLVERKWLLSYLGMSIWNQILTRKNNAKKLQYTTNDDYSNLLETFRSSQLKGVVPLKIGSGKVNS